MDQLFVGATFSTGYIYRAATFAKTLSWSASQYQNGSLLSQVLGEEPHWGGGVVGATLLSPNFLQLSFS